MGQITRIREALGHAACEHVLEACEALDPGDTLDFALAALERDDVKHHVIIRVIARMREAIPNLVEAEADGYAEATRLEKAWIEQISASSALIAQHILTHGARE